MEFKARNYNQLAPVVYQALFQYGLPGPSRNGDVVRLPGVTTLIVERPWERVNFDPYRDANPFFHLLEAMSMLAPHNDAEFLAHFAKNMLSYSDDGKTFNAFYGTRIFQHGEYGDQLQAVIDTLTADPDSRQCVVQIWHPSDLRKVTKDKACNLLMIFSVNEKGELTMTTVNRSNDAIWGILTGANVVHFSFFQEYVALALGRVMGPWTHVTNNLHVYTANPKWPGIVHSSATAEDWYETKMTMSVTPLWLPTVPVNCEPLNTAFREAAFKAIVGMKWAIQNRVTYCEHSQHFPFLRDTVQHVFNTWQLHKGKFPEEIILKEAALIQAPDWKLACTEWLQRRFHERSSIK